MGIVHLLERGETAEGPGQRGCYIFNEKDYSLDLHPEHWVHKFSDPARSRKSVTARFESPRLWVWTLSESLLGETRTVTCLRRHESILYADHLAS